jgi:bifunctional non-homologous end joining protein LigD
VIDGEICALDEHGRPSFSALQQGAERPVYYFFDLLEENGEATIDLPLEERRARFAALVGRADPLVVLSEGFEDG